MKRPTKLVEVVWEDAHSFGTSSWSNFDEDCKRAIHKPVLCISVGYIIPGPKEILALVATCNFDTDGEIGQISGHMSIPRGMIRKIRHLK